MLRLCLLLIALLPLTGHAESVTQPAQRIVSLGSSITETVYALGEANRLIAVDSTSQFPPAARALPDVGYLRTLAAEGILSLEPDLILASHEAGPPQVLAQLRNAGVRVEVLQTGPTAEHALIAMEQLGQILGKAESSKKLAQSNRQKLQQLAARYQGQEARPRVLFILGGHGAQPIIGGGDTKANTMIELALGQNAAISEDSSFTSYRPSNPEALLGMAPDVIVAASHGIETIGGVDRLLKDSNLGLTPAGRSGRVIVMDSALLLGMGPRMADAATELAEKIHARQNQP
ncbi:MAG: heme/hemin ABC transporter substrate-binding protein [Nevskiales bacterium]